MRLLRLIFIAMLMMVAPILNIYGLVELKTLIGVAVGFWLCLAFSLLLGNHKTSIRKLSNA